MMIAALAVAGLLILWLGIGIGSISADTQIQTDNCDTYRCDTYRVEIYDDGSVVIHTWQRYLTNQGDDLVIKAEQE